MPIRVKSAVGDRQPSDDLAAERGSASLPACALRVRHAFQRLTYLSEGKILSGRFECSHAPEAAMQSQYTSHLPLPVMAAGYRTVSAFHKAGCWPRSVFIPSTRLGTTRDNDPLFP